MVYSIDLTGQVAIITGANKGIGAATAEILAQAGAQVVMVDIVTPDKAQGTISSVSKFGLPPMYLCEDISSEDGSRKMVKRTVEEFGCVDILVNNAGVVADWDVSWDVHVKGVYYCSEAVKGYMAERRYGRIVNISSTAAYTGSTGIPQYVASKGGTNALTRFLARNYAPLGILVNGIAPSVIKSDMLMTRYKDEKELLAHYVPQMPIRRIGYPVDIARIVLFLCSNLSGYICGEIIIADGGRMNVG
ncbi:MAG: SDR family oxidoreductase [Firmicutes bacterium]|nr:SDR family oxidoreductase [Bacillota bacterium]